MDNLTRYSPLPPFQLLKNLGNLVQRGLSFAFATFGCVPGIKAPLEPRDTAFVAAVNSLLQQYNSAMTGVHLKTGLKLVMEISAEGNKYMQDTKPWDLMKGGAPERGATVITLVASLIRLLATISEPFMPGFAEKVVYTLALPHIDIPDEFAVCIPEGHVILKPTPLFNAIPPSQIESFREQFSGAQVLGSSASPATGASAAVATGAPAAGGKGVGASKKPAASTALLDIEQIDLRVGRIVRAWAHPEADKLWCEEIDLGEGAPRTIASGLRQHYSLEDMQGRRVIVVANLKPRTMVGFNSQGMVLCASNADRSVVEFVEPPADARIGERIRVQGFSESTDAAPDTVNPAKKANPWLTVAPVRGGQCFACVISTNCCIHILVCESTGAAYGRQSYRLFQKLRSANIHWPMHCSHSSQCADQLRFCGRYHSGAKIS